METCINAARILGIPSQEASKFARYALAVNTFDFYRHLQLTFKDMNQFSSLPQTSEQAGSSPQQW